MKRHRAESGRLHDDDSCARVLEKQKLIGNYRVYGSRCWVCLMAAMLMIYTIWVFEDGVMGDVDVDEGMESIW